MSRITLSDEMSILNELSYMEERLYKGTTTELDVKYSIKTIRNLLLELYFVKQNLNPEEAEELDLHIKNAIAASNAAMRVYESNKPF